MSGFAGQALRRNRSLFGERSAVLPFVARDALAKNGIARAKVLDAFAYFDDLSGYVGSGDRLRQAARGTGRSTSRSDSTSEVP